MEPKIPIACLTNSSKVDNSLIDKIKCAFCQGISLDPLYSKRDNKTYCKECFYQYYNFDKNSQYIDIGKFYSKIEINLFEGIKELKFYCPLCIKNNINDNNKIEYTYNSLLVHLVICPNKILIKKLCKNYNCDNKNDIYLKDIVQKKNIYDLLLNNYILEKEIENEKLKLNFQNYKKYLNEQINVNKNMFINKKRKNEISENSGNKSISCKSKKSGNNKNNKYNNNKDVGGKSHKKLEKNDNAINLVDICEHWKGNFKSLFSCCPNEYGCVDCHFNKEQHHLVFSGEVLCLLCYQKYKGDKCPFCGVEKCQKRKNI